MNKLKSVFMIVLMMLGTFGTSGAALAQGVQTTGGGAEEILSSKPIMDKNDSVNVNPNDTKTIYENVAVKSNVEVPDVVYSIIDLPKNVFEKPHQEDLTTDTSQVKNAEISETTNSYQIKYTYTKLVAGSESSVPFKVRTSNNFLPGTILPITDKTFDGGNNLLSNGGEVDLKYDPITPSLKLEDKVTYTTKDNVDSDNKLLNDVSGIISLTVSDEYPSDPRDHIIKVNIPEPLEFDPNSSSSSGWTYDEATRTATYISKASADGSRKNPFKLEVPVIVSKGSSSDTKYLVHGDISTSDSPDSPFSSVDGSMLVKVKEDDPDPNVVPGDGSTTFEFRKDSSGSYGDNEVILPSTSQVDIRAILRPVQPKNYTEGYAESTVKSIDYNPRSTFTAGSKHHGYFGNEDIDGYTSVFNSASLTTRTADSMVNGEISKNKLTVEYIDGTSETVKNVQSSSKPGQVKFNEKNKLVKKATLTFDNPVHLSQKDGGDLALQFDGKFDNNAFQKVKALDYQRYNFGGVMYVHYESEDPNKQLSTQIGDFTFTKTTPSITSNSLKFSPESNLLSGNTINAESSFNVYSDDFLKNKNLKNGKVVYVFDKPGIKLSTKDLGNIKNLKNVKVINNFKKTGKTAIIGDITNGTIIDNSSKLEYSIPITNSSSLKKGKINVEVFLVFDNDLSTYNYTKISDGGYDIDESNMNLDYELYTNTDYPNGRVKLTGEMNYSPPAKLNISKLVSVANSDNWVEDTGNLAKKSGEMYSYQLQVDNYSLNDDMSSVDAIDILPHSNDKMILNSATNPDGLSRGSQFDMKMTGPIDDIPDGYTVLYSMDAVKEGQGLAANLDSNWVPADQVNDWSNVTMIRLQSNEGTTLERGQSIQLHYDVTTPKDIDYGKEQMAGNSFALQAENQQGTVKEPIESNTATIRTASQDPIIPDDPDVDGTIRVEKVDANENTKFLPGAEFKLTDSDGNAITGVTSKNGSVNFENLAFGNYELVETKAPEGYDLSDKIYKVTVDKDNVRQTITVKDELTKTEDETGSLRVKKVDASDTTKLLPGAEFKLAGPNDKVYTGTTDKDGSLTFNNLAYGDYELTETKAPDNYDLNKKSFKITIDKDNVYQTIVVKDSLTSENHPTDPGTNDPTVPGKKPSKPGNEETVTPKNSNDKAKSKKDSHSSKNKKNFLEKYVLPQTGEDIRNASILSIIGVILISLVGYTVARKRKN